MYKYTGQNFQMHTCDNFQVVSILRDSQAEVLQTHRSISSGTLCRTSPYCMVNDTFRYGKQGATVEDVADAI